MDDDGPPQRLQHLQQRRYRRLTGSFMPVEYDPIKMGDTIKDPHGFRTYYDQERPQWSSRAIKARELWGNETYRKRTVAKRQQTVVHRGKQRPPKLPGPPLSPSGQKRSESMKLLRGDEAAWVRQRLAGGEEARRRLHDDDYKLQLQKQRGEVARRRSAARKAAAAASVRAGAERAKPKS